MAYIRIKLDCPTPVSSVSLIRWLNAQGHHNESMPPVKIGVNLYAQYFGATYKRTIGFLHNNRLIATLDNANRLTMYQTESSRVKNRLWSILGPTWTIHPNEGRRTAVEFRNGDYTVPIERLGTFPIRDPNGYVGRVFEGVAEVATTWHGAPLRIGRAIQLAAELRAVRERNYHHLLRLRRDRDHTTLREVMRALSNPTSAPLATERLTRVFGSHPVVCRYCSGQAWSVNTEIVVSAGGRVCSDCLAAFYERCTRCESYTRQGRLMEIPGHGTMCSSCANAGFRHCAVCSLGGGSVYHEINAVCPNRVDPNCQCEAPHREFAFPCNGHGTVGPNARFAIETAAGEISEEGMRQMWDVLHYNLPHVEGLRVDAWAELGEVGPQWQTERGNFPKRLSRALYKNRNIKLTPEVITQIGNISRMQTAEQSTYHLELTRDLNQNPSAFMNDRSCWWTMYASGRCAFKGCGGIGLRSFASADSAEPIGRVWIIPLNAQLMPTHDATTAAAFVLFNGYKGLSGYSGARIVAQMARMTYRKIGFTCSPMSINGATAYLVAPQDIVRATQKIALYMPAHNYVEEAA